MASNKNIFRITNIVPTKNTLFQDGNYQASDSRIVKIQSNSSVKYLVIGIIEDSGITIDNIGSVGKSYAFQSLGIVEKNSTKYNVFYSFLDTIESFTDIEITLSEGTSVEDTLVLSTSSTLLQESYPTSKFFLKNKIHAEDTRNWSDEELRQWADDSCDDYNIDESICTGELDAEHPYIYCTKRTFGYHDNCYDDLGNLLSTAVKSWSKWGIPKLWSHYGQDSSGFSLTLDNSNESIYYASKKSGSKNIEDYVATIDPEGCSTGAIRFNGGIINSTNNGEIEIDRLYIKDGNNSYYFIDCNNYGENIKKLIYSENSGMEIDLSCGWTIKVKLEKIGNNLQFSLVDCKIKAETAEKSDYLELLNSVARISICAYNFQNNIERTTVWTISAIQDVDANGIKRYRITPTPRNFVQTETYYVDPEKPDSIRRGSKSFNTSNITFKIEYDTYDTSWQGFDESLGDYYVILKNALGESIHKTDKLNSSTLEISRDVILANNSVNDTDLNPQSLASTIFAELYIKDPDWQKSPQGDAGYYRVDSLEISVNYLYLRVERGPAGAPGINGSNSSLFSYTCSNDEINAIVNDTDSTISDIEEIQYPVITVRKNSKIIGTTVNVSSNITGINFVTNVNDNNSVTLIPKITYSKEYLNNLVIYVNWTAESIVEEEEHFFAGTIKIRIRKDSNGDGVNDYFLVISRDALINANVDANEKIHIKAIGRSITSSQIADFKLQYKFLSESTWENVSSSNSEPIECSNISLKDIYEKQGLFVRILTADPDYGGSEDEWVEADSEFIEPDAKIIDLIGDELNTKIQDYVKQEAILFIMAGDPKQNISCDASGKPIANSEIISDIITSKTFKIGSVYVEYVTTSKETISSKLTLNAGGSEYETELDFEDFRDFSAKISYDVNNSRLRIYDIETENFPETAEFALIIKTLDNTSLSTSITVKKITDRNNDGIITTYLLEADRDVVFYENGQFIPKVINFKVWEDTHTSIRTLANINSGNFALTTNTDAHLDTITNLGSNDGYNITINTEDLFNDTISAENVSVSLYIKGNTDYDTDNNSTTWDWVDSENIKCLGEINKASTASKGDAGKIIRTRSWENLAEGTWCYSSDDVSSDDAKKYYDIVTWYGSNSEEEEKDLLYYECVQSGQKGTEPSPPTDNENGLNFKLADALFDFAQITTLISDKIKADSLLAEEIIVTENDIPTAGLINGNGNIDKSYRENTDIRIFAGASKAGTTGIEKAAFRVTKSGEVFASNFNGMGNFKLETIVINQNSPLVFEVTRKKLEEYGLTEKWPLESTSPDILILSQDVDWGKGYCIDFWNCGGNLLTIKGTLSVNINFVFPSLYLDSGDVSNPICNSLRTKTLRDGNETFISAQELIQLEGKIFNIYCAEPCVKFYYLDENGKASVLGRYASGYSSNRSFQACLRKKMEEGSSEISYYWDITDVTSKGLNLIWKPNDALGLFKYFLGDINTIKGTDAAEIFDQTVDSCYKAINSETTPKHWITLDYLFISDKDAGNSLLSKGSITNYPSPYAIQYSIEKNNLESYRDLQYSIIYAYIPEKEMTLLIVKEIASQSHEEGVRLQVIQTDLTLLNESNFLQNNKWNVGGSILYDSTNENCEVNTIIHLSPENVHLIKYEFLLGNEDAFQTFLLHPSE